MQQELSSISGRTPKPRKASANKTSAKSPRKGRRYAMFGGFALIGVLGLAWMDGGEEPIRTIVQPVERAGGSS